MPYLRKIALLISKILEYITNYIHAKMPRDNYINSIPLSSTSKKDL